MSDNQVTKGDMIKIIQKGLVLDIILMTIGVAAFFTLSIIARSLLESYWDYFILFIFPHFGWHIIFSLLSIASFVTSISYLIATLKSLKFKEKPNYAETADILSITEKRVKWRFRTRVGALSLLLFSALGVFSLFLVVLLSL